MTAHRWTAPVALRSYPIHLGDGQKRVAYLRGVLPHYREFDATFSAVFAIPLHGAILELQFRPIFHYFHGLNGERQTMMFVAIDGGNFPPACAPVSHSIIPEPHPYRWLEQPYKALARQLKKADSKGRMP